MSEKIYNMVDLETIEKLADIVSAKAVCYTHQTLPRKLEL